MLECPRLKRRITRTAAGQFLPHSVTQKAPIIKIKNIGSKYERMFHEGF